VASSRRRGAAVLAALLPLSAACGGPAGEATAPPPIEVVDVPGLQRWLQARRGTPLLVNFWATWCQPCCEEMPDLIAGTRAFRDRGGVVVGVAMECWVRDVTAAQGEARVRATAPRLGIDFPVLVCSEGDIAALRGAFGEDLGVLPQTLAIDRGGAITARHEGKGTREEFAALAAGVLQ
jgi:peroxiredoxin